MYYVQGTYININSKMEVKYSDTFLLTCHILWMWFYQKLAELIINSQFIFKITLTFIDCLLDP